MNIIRRRYDVILKLTIMLALIGCFFIAGGKDVKAALATLSSVDVDSDGNLNYTATRGDEATTLRFHINDTSISSTTQIGSEISISTDADKTGSISASDILAAAARNGKSGDSVIIYYTLTKEGTTEGTTATSTTKKANEIYKAETSAGCVLSSGGVDIAQITISKYSGSVEINGNVAYCYKDAKVNFTTVNVNSAYVFWNAWSSDGTIATKHTDKITKSIVTDGINVDIKYIPVYKKIVTDVQLTNYPEKKILVGGASTSQEYALSLEPNDTGIDVTDSGVVTCTLSPSSGAGNNQYVSGTATLSLKPFESYVGEITATFSIKDGLGPDIPFKKTFTFEVVKALTGVTISAPTEGYKDTAMTLTATPNTGASVSNYSWQVSSDNGGTWTGISGNTATVTYTPTATGSYKFKVTATDASDNTNTREATTSAITVKDNKLTKLEFGADTYEVTVGYKVSATVQATPTAALVSDDVNFSLPSETTATIASSSENETTGVATAVVKGVKSGDVTLTAKGKTNTTVTDTAKIKVYASPTDSSAFKYTESTRVLKGALPDKVLVGNTSYDIDKVTGFKIYVMKGSEQLGTITYKDKGTTGESSASDLESIIKDNVSKFSGDTDTIKLRAVALGTYGSSSDIREAKDESGNLLAWETSVTVYHMVANTSDGIASATVDTSYALEGQSVTFTATAASGSTFQKWVSGTSTTGTSASSNLTYTTTAKKSGGNTYTAVAGVRSSSSGSTDDTTSGYDDVPKTSESNMPFIFIIFSVFAVIGTGYALYMTLRPARSSGTDDTDDYDE